jgi:phage gpG-like protein
MPFTFKSTGLSLGRKLQKLSTEGKAVAREAIRSEVTRLIEEGFEQRVEPRGRAWEPRKKFYPWPILEKTGALRRGIRVDAQTSDIKVTADAPYANVHQTGWRQGGERQAARQFVPMKVMPLRWKKRIDAVVRLALQALK